MGSKVCATLEAGLWGWDMNEGTDDGNPDLLTSTGRKQAQRPSGIVDRLKSCKRALLKEAGMDNDREHARSAGLGRVEEAREFECGDERGGEEVSADEKNGDVGCCQRGGHFDFPERTSLELGVIPDNEARRLLTTSEMDAQTLGVAEILAAIAEEHLFVWRHSFSGVDLC